MTDPTVLVGISVYRQPLDWVVRSIKSVQSQDFESWRLIIRLDGTHALDTDKVNYLKSYVAECPKIQLLLGETQVGTFFSYRIIFSDCKCPYLCQLDADDFLAPSALSDSLNALLDHPSAPYSYSYCGLFDQDDNVYGVDQRALYTWSFKSELTRFITYHFRLVRSTCYLRVGGYRGDYLYAGDYDLCLRLSELGPPLFVPKILYLYRVHSDSASQQFQVRTHEESISAVRAALNRRDLRHSYLLSSSMHFSLQRLEEFKGPILIAGLHRSGTSLMCRILSRCGLEFPGDLQEPDQDNSTGYYENSTFVSLHRTWFSGLPYDAWPDWGLSSNSPISPLGKYEWTVSAENFVSTLDRARIYSSESNSEPFWGLKDPRSTLILPFWRSIFNQNLLVVGVYRTPWDISDAFMRISNPLFRVQPHLVLSSWLSYNEALLSYLEAYPHSSSLFASSWLVQDPMRIIKCLKERWGIGLSQLNQDHGLFKQNYLLGLSGVAALYRLYSIAYPRVYEVLCALDAVADLSTVVTLNSVHPLLATTSELVNTTVSVIIPTYNPCHFLLEAIASVETAAEGIPVELIIVDDGSDCPESLRLLSALRDSGYNIVVQSNSGLSSARNLGFSLAKSPFVLPLDDDNRALSPYFTHGLDFLLTHPECGWVYGNQLNFGFEHFVHRPGPFDSVSLKTQNYIDACALVRKSMWVSVGGYDIALCALEDWDFWLTSSSFGFHAFYLDMACFEYRVRENSMLRRHLADECQHQSVISYLRSKHGNQIKPLNSL